MIKNNNPKISIIIPVYNVEKYLRRCLDSVLNQTFTDWVAICVDDGSTDNSGQILSEYAARDARFIIISKKNGGQSDARNAGMKYATGDYILFLDSDDFIHPQTLEIAYGQIVKNNVDMFLFDYDKKFHRKLTKLMKRGIINIAVKSGNQNKIYNPTRVRVHKIKNILFHCTERNHTLRVLHPVRRHCFPVLGLYRREFLSDLPFVRGIIYEDFVWWSELILRNPRTVMTQLPLYFYMPNPSSTLNSAKAFRTANSIIDGLARVYKIYSDYANAREMAHYQREFLWPFIIIAMQHVRQITDSDDCINIRKKLKRLYETGAFSNPPNNRAHRYMRRIQDFLNA